jgi:hypothetical protein
LDRLERAIGEGEDEHADGQHLEGVLRRRRHARHGEREDVKREGGNHQLAVANLVAHHATDDDAEAESRETGAANRAQLGPGEAIFAGPIVENTAADAEAHPGGKDCHKARPQQPFGVGNDGLVADLNVTHRCESTGGCCRTKTYGRGAPTAQTGQENR